ncbi:MAG: export ABC transporter ATP-binding protein [Candidatus Cloacimonadota bacterium]|nr:MAG: export ABC transporter ATP-binding protein [Candidatus Cloacimonadota bacterium]
MPDDIGVLYKNIKEVILIEIKNLSKNYGDIQALQDVSLKIEDGELFGLLGPNGAGKTTMINILNTYLPFEQGDVFINNFNVQKDADEIKGIVGVIPQEISLYDELTAMENLCFWGEIYGLSGKKLKQKCEETLKLVGLFDRKNDALKKYSGGMKRRINIAAGLLHNPQIILMDEPTIGVDPQSRNFIFEMIKRLHQQGKTIIYTTHYMEEAEKLCTKIAIIDYGKIIALGTKQELYDLLGEQDIIMFKFKEKINFLDYQKLLNNFSIKQFTDTSFQLSGKHLIKQLANIIKIINELPNETEEIDIVQPNLESVFLKLTGRELRE